jgi:hypothetical protein
MKPIRIEGNLIVVAKELWRDAGGKARRKAAKALLCGPEIRQPSSYDPQEPA